MKFYSVAIDGPAGAGKSTMARRAAAELNFVYVDTGAIYRTVGFAALRAGIDPKNADAVAALLPSLHLELQWTPDGVQHVVLNDDDLVFEQHGVKVVVDPKSLVYLDGIELDYVKEGLNEGFKYNNPNVKESCGCGESFHV